MVELSIDKQVAEQNLEKSKLEAEKKLVEAEATKKANELLQETLTDELIMKQFYLSIPFVFYWLL